MRRSPIFAFAGALAVLVALAIASTGSAGRASPSVTACSLVTAAKAAKIVGYPVRLSKGETLQDCNIVAVPIKIQDGRTVRPTIIVEVDPTSAALYKRLAKGGHPVAGLGSRAFISYNTSINGFFIGAEVRGKLLQLSVAASVKPISHPQGITLAKLIASKI